MSASPSHDVESVVRSRYAAGAAAVQPALCCPSAGYDKRLLAALPAEIIDKDYGCGDPTRYAEPGDVVIDLGSGAGKACYMIAQKVGPTGRVIGVDFNDAMLDLARRHQPDIAAKIGYDNVRFVKARIQDLALDMARVQQWLDANPVHTVEDAARLDAECDRLSRDKPLIADDSADLIVSNCVLNLVKPAQKRALFAEMFRVLRRGGRAVISDIVCDEDPTQAMIDDPELWSGCVSGAFREDRFVAMFAEAGFHGVEVLDRQTDPWRVIDGIEFRSMTVRAYKGKAGPCLERHQAVVYRGPFSCVHDDDGHRYERGMRMAVCDKTYRLLTDPRGPYAGMFLGIEPHEQVVIEDAGRFDCAADAIRNPRLSKQPACEMNGADPTACCVPNDGGKCC